MSESIHAPPPVKQPNPTGHSRWTDMPTGLMAGPGHAACCSPPDSSGRSTSWPFSNLAPDAREAVGDKANSVVTECPRGLFRWTGFPIAARPTAEMWWADSSATAQPRLWLTTSTLCPSGSSTNAPSSPGGRPRARPARRGHRLGRARSAFGNDPRTGCEPPDFAAEWRAGTIACPPNRGSPSTTVIQDGRPTKWRSTRSGTARSCSRTST
jgi:hypothetical protein